MNIDLLRAKASDVVTSIEVAMEEVGAIEASRKALENSSYVNTAREKRLNERDSSITQREKEVDAQKKYIEEQNRNTQLILNRITQEKESLKGLEEQKRHNEKERLEIEVEKKGLEALQAEKTKLLIDREALEKERRIFSQEKLANQELKKRLDILDKRLETERIRLQNLYNSV